MRRLPIPLILALLGAPLAPWLVPDERERVRATLAAFPDADAASQQLRPLVLAAICFLPAVGGLCYLAGGTIARYISRQFLAIFAICFAGLALIWILIDFQDNLEELRLSGDIAGGAARLYGARLPELMVTLIPYALLLSLLFCLGKLSNSREIVAMIQTGRGLARLTTPFLITGVLCALLCAGLNYQWAPRAIAAEKRILDTIRGLDETAAEFVKFRNPRQPRLWMVGAFPPDYQQGAPLQRVRVIEEGPDRHPHRILTARSARWSPADGSWSFAEPQLKKLTRGEAPEFVRDLPDPLVVRDWHETPEEIIQPGLPPGQLGVPGLRAWLKQHPPGSRESRAAHLTQWHHRWAQPFNCLVMVMLATPLGVVFSRRGASGGVAVTVFLCAGLMFLTTISLSLGDAGHLPPILAAWLPNLVFGGLALYLFRLRLTGRPIYQTLRRLIPNAA